MPHARVAIWAAVTTALRIVHCFRSPVGGVFRHVRDLVTAQAAAGHHVGIICDSSADGSLESAYFGEIEHTLKLGMHRMNISRTIGLSDIAAGWRTYKLIKELQPDVLHGHGAKGGALARTFGSLLRVFRYRVARVYSPHGGVLHYDAGTARGKLLFGIESTLARLTDHLLFVSDFERRIFYTKVGASSVPSTVVYNGVSDAEFTPVAAEPGAADLLFIGMFRDLKGPDIFIDAVSIASRHLGRPVRAVMVGHGHDQPAYRAQAAVLGNNDVIRFLPPMPARDAFALARIVVVPSRAEAMPYIVLEALAASKPVIATTVGGIPEVFGATSPALSNADPENLANTIVTAMHDESSFAAQMPSQTELQARFSATTMGSEVEAAYRKALNRSAI